MRRCSMTLFLAVGPCLAAAGAEGGDAAALAASIDRHIQARLEAEGVKRAPEADDAEFLRRVFLDLHGVIPTAESAARFLDGSDLGKRARLIDELIESPRFGEHLADVWRKRLLSPLASVERAKAQRFADWLAARFNDRGWDRIVHDLLTATGRIEENPAVAYLIEGRNPLAVTDLTDLTSRYFLGVRLNCAQCHDHPSTGWKQEDYWGMAAFFAQIQTPRRPKLVHTIGVQDDPQWTLASLRDSSMFDGFQVEPPTFLGGGRLEIDAEATHRVALARWMTSPGNPFFARAAVNRMWWCFFGRGIVNPVDDMHTGNPPSHPELLEHLSERFVASGFDLKFLCRAIANSRTYQQTSRPGAEAESETRLFARMAVKVLTAEQLHDSLVAILGPPGKRAGPEARHEFCNFFASDGDPDPTRYDRGIPHLLRLMNSPELAGRRVEALVARIARRGCPADEVVNDLFLTILTRRPTPAEKQLAQDHLRDAGAPPETAWRELAWALLMQSEFVLNR